MKTPRILLVNQDLLLLWLDEAELRHAGYQTQGATSGVQALAKLAQGEFDLVLIGRNLPELDGFGLIRTLRATGNRIPVMMVSIWIAADGGLPADVRDEIAVALPRPAKGSALRAGVARALRWLPEVQRPSGTADASPVSASAGTHRCCPTRRSAMRAFISAKLAVVIAVITIAAGLLAYEWHQADSAKAHHTTGHHHSDTHARGTK